MDFDDNDIDFQMRLKNEYDTMKMMLNEKNKMGHLGIDILISSEENLNLDLLGNDISFKSLAALNLEDLEILGIKNENKRKQIIEEISHLPNQLDHYDKVIRETNLEEYKEDVLKAVSNQLENLKASLAAAFLKMRVIPPEDNVLNDGNYSSSLVLKVIDEMGENLENIKKQLFDLQGRKIVKKSTKMRKLFDALLIIGSLSVSSFLLYSACKSRF